MRSPGLTRASVQSSLWAGVVGCHLFVAGWSIVLVAWLVCVGSSGVGRSFGDELAGTLGGLGPVGLGCWVAGAMSAALGWLGLRVVRGGHARLVAVLTVVLGAAFIVVPLLAVVGLPFMALPVGVGIAAWHLVQAAWFRVRAEGRTARVASLGHLVAALMVAASVLVAALARHRATTTEAGALAVAVLIAALAAIVAHLATARYMAAARPWVDLVDSFG